MRKSMQESNENAKIRKNEQNANSDFKYKRILQLYTRLLKGEVINKAKDPTATRFEHLTYMDLLNKGLQVMDSTATSMCMDNDMELVVFNMNEKGNIVKAMKGEAVCTRINKEEK